MDRTALVVFLFVGISSTYADDLPPNPLSQKDIADGWIALFDGKTTFGWTSPNDSKWTNLDGMLAPQRGKPGLLVTTSLFRSYDLVMEFQQSSAGTLDLVLGCDSEGKPLTGREKSIRALDRARSGTWVYRAGIRDGQLVDESLSSRGAGFDKKRPSPPMVESKIAGHIALKGNGYIISKLMLRPIDLHPLLDGRVGLDGWKEFPGRKSKFSVNKEGWLSLKDGPGDLQTTKEWTDFVLQLECKTNGKHLNSGVFFRCLPGEYQMGYEAQIHNGFGPEKEIALEVYDPKTNKPLEKKKEKVTALDFGTGAIYRRQPARFQASKDEEWFTMTVVARGRHMATWVNGVQVVDWTDHRPVAENARKGAYLKAGPISLQGHDPTTDLLFRNIRIAELPAK